MAELEGFICPLCMMSLPGVSLLEKHVRENHDDTATGKMKANFKQFIDKAKSSLSKGKLAQDGPVSEGAAAVGHPSDGSDDGNHHLINTSGINPLLWPEQEFGCNRDHMQRFRSKRDAKVQRIVVETNRLLVRLEKLLKLLKNQHTMKPKQLKTLEQEIVPWKKDSDQKRCMKCLREFNLRRRKHHCRLCGDIICKSCSSFFPLSEAYQLMSTNPSYRSLLPDPSSAKRGKFRKVRKDDDQDEDEETSDELRVCPTCEELLVSHLAKMISQSVTELTAIYESMRLTMQEADKLKPTYLEMAESLWNGQYQFRLVESHDVRQNLVKLYEVIDSRSKQIMNLKYDHGREPSAVSQKIQKNIRVYASTYLQENLLSLPALPTKEKLKEIREEKERFAEERRLELMRKKEMQKEQEIASAAAAAKKELSMSKLEVSFSVLDSKLRLSPTFTRKAKAVFGIKNDSSNTNRNSTGWTAEHKFTDTQEAELDPFELQRQQLLGYISQAQQAKRFDEVATLKESLREIEALMEEQRET